MLFNSTKKHISQIIKKEYQKGNLSDLDIWKNKNYILYDLLKCQIIYEEDEKTALNYISEVIEEIKEKNKNEQCRF